MKNLSIQQINEIYKQMAYAEDITGYKPERIILGLNVFKELTNFIEFVNCMENIDSDIIFEGMNVTIDYRNKGIIKVVPDIKM